ncbi:MAG TPA: hypothetical protein VH012_03695 [Acidimicrobiales bacterium]|jgi:hypothetical protein|nr:hypothetical protein [Acidimicrobiales bacterium]
MKPGPGLVCGVVLVAVLVVSTCGSAGAANPSALPGKKTVQYPSFLPKKTLDPTVDATLIGTVAKPALQTEGLAIEAKTKSFHVDVTVSGPIVPGEGLPDQPAATTCTWTVTMKNASGNVPVSIADFHSVDHVGSVFLMGLVPGEHVPAPVLHPHQTLTFKLRSYELVGEGMMQWAPDHKHVVGYWDYTVEND